MPFESFVVVTIWQLTDNRHRWAFHRERYGLRHLLFDLYGEGSRSKRPGSGSATGSNAAHGKSEDEQRDQTVDQ